MTLNSWMEKYITCKGFLKVELFSLAFFLHLGQSISTIKYITVRFSQKTHLSKL